MEKPYRDLAGYLRARLGGKTAKIAIDGGFTCPNRDGTVGTGGCAFCSAAGGGDFAERTGCGTPRAIREAVLARLDSPHARRADRFIAYFQAFSSTYAPVSVLRERYAAALCDARMVGLSVGTRPDCITKEIVDLFAEIAKTHYVSVELGLQTASDETANAMGIACPRTRFAEAVEMLASRGLDTVAHLMIGLPGESREDYLRTMDLVNRLPVTGIKLHSVYVLKNTRLAEMHARGEYTPLSREEYVDAVCELLAHARPDLVIHRLGGDAPKRELVAPAWNADKRTLLDAIHESLALRGIRQGCAYSPKI